MRRHAVMIATLFLISARLAAQTHQHQPTAPPVSPTSLPALTLEQLEQMASERNPTLKQAEAELRAAEGRKRQAGLYPNPTMGYQGQEIRGGSFRGGEQGAFVQQDI